jgi:uncharacterized membrane protein HdeD (DUF308 family)
MVAVAARQWWVLALQGILGILFGVIAIALPDVALATIALLFAAWAIVSGISQLAEGWRVAEARGRSWPFAVGGIVSLVAGIIAAIVPGITILGIVLVLGAWLVIQGAMEVYAAWRIRREITGEWILALFGIVRVVLGVIILAMPIVGVVFTVALLATWSIVGGVAALLLGYRLRQFSVGRTGTNRTAAAGHA